MYRFRKLLSPGGQPTPDPKKPKYRMGRASNTLAGRLERERHASFLKSFLFLQEKKTHLRFRRRISFLVLLFLLLLLFYGRRISTGRLVIFIKTTLGRFVTWLRPTTSALLSPTGSFRFFLVTLVPSANKNSLKKSIATESRLPTITEESIAYDWLAWKAPYQNPIDPHFVRVSSRSIVRHFDANPRHICGKVSLRERIPNPASSILLNHLLRLALEMRWEYSYNLHAG